MPKKKSGIAKPLATAATIGAGAIGLSLLSGGPSAALTTLEFEGATAGALASLYVVGKASHQAGKLVKEYEKEKAKKKVKEVL